MPPGVPTKEQWVKINRNIDVLEDLRTNTLSRIGLINPLHHKYRLHTSKQLSNEINSVRKMIRDNKFLSSPYETKSNIESISGHQLDKEFVNFEKICLVNQKMYEEWACNYNFTSESKKPGLPKIIITDEDRHNAENINLKTKAQIHKAIEELLLHLGNFDENLSKTYTIDLTQNMKKMTKLDFINFHDELLDKIDEVTSQKATLVNPEIPLY